MPRYCERCDTSFADTFLVCPLCGDELSLLSAPQEEQVWAVVSVASNPTNAAILDGLLAAWEIPHLMAKRGVSMYPAPDSGMELYLVLVPGDQLAAAQELLAGAERGELSVTEDGFEEET